ncbi:sugar dehydrogenase [Floricoccus tropicus]|uniref:Sugar dehydrogenase n=1 Tax=Floricoccus tropicus TaxID=1859473 RepID=A0A1E8GLG3_9LACT|nr:glucose 1-dehydrogenase [Floricoccus tropicus]OFI49085.1 sugar dehydrogenase [Floricoccus tropicus]
MYGELHGKVAVITGAATGLGLAISLRYILEGMNVVGDYVGTLPDELADAEKKHPDRVKFVEADVSDEKQVEGLAQTAIDTFGTIDVWVNNAGIEKACHTAEMPFEDWKNVLAVNLDGVFLGSREALKHFTANKKKGTIINMSSVHQQIPWPTFAHYAASKGATEMFTKTIALEYADQGIRANCIAPGAINTPINAKKFSDPKQLAQTESMVPMGTIGKPQDIANAAAFLASDEASYITGTTLFVDGGMTLYPSFQYGAG